MKAKIFPGLIILLIAITGCSSDKNYKKIKVLVPQSTSSIPLLYMAEMNLFHGYEVETEFFTNHMQALVRMLRGDAAFLFTGTSQGWENRMSGSPIVILNTGVWGVSYLLGTGENVKTMADLRGLRIGLPFPGSPLDVQTRYILIKNGIDPDKECNIRYAPFTQAYPLLVRGDLDVAAFPEPMATKLVTSGNLFRLIDYKEAWASVNGGEESSPQVSLFTVKDFAAENGGMIRDFVSVWREATEFTKSNPGIVAEKFAKAMQMSVPIVKEAVANTLFSIPDSEKNKKFVNEYFVQINELLFLKKSKLPDDFFITTD
ncbi:MAG: ABC transporter substrate-binding protein [Spirochaetales bacterium]|nr:ABC transporter substrate-binding protein [Spirochaetales bacterium]